MNPQSTKRRSSAGKPIANSIAAIAQIEFDFKRELVFDEFIIFNLS